MRLIVLFISEKDESHGEYRSGQVGFLTEPSSGEGSAPGGVSRECVPGRGSPA
ncbi:hypothetical protein SSP531S_27550 [Streptomyces spongiicola]|uniref:Uncharacterized protein n=1 Tax=Streptomyces spongiicola TaxID=1690221 RepID=A0A388SZM4_9ACTN|nr:hypothetical protein SSP531S_27550 [Streptomyces spongiicola]